MSRASAIARALSKVDWDFSQAIPGATRPIHWYPGTFPGSMPATIIELLTERGDLVFDPYGGVGTTGAEALRLGRKAWVNDGHPIATLAAYAHMTIALLRRLDAPYLNQALQIIRATTLRVCGQHSRRGSSFEFEWELGDESDTRRKLGRLVRPNAEEFVATHLSYVPNWEALAPWFHPQVLDALMRIVRSIDEDHADDPLIRLLAAVAISSALRTLSSQNSSWGHIADRVLPREFMEKDVARTLAQALKRIERVEPAEISSLTSIWARCSSVVWPDGITPSVEKHSAKLLVTSPPYPGAIDYTLAQRLSLYFLGYTDDELALMVRGEIGARRKRNSSISETSWKDAILAGVSRQAGYVADDGFICFIIPHRDHRTQNGFEAISGHLEKEGWGLAFKADRAIRQERARQSWTSIKKETIALFSRGD